MRASFHFFFFWLLFFREFGEESMGDLSYRTVLLQGKQHGNPNVRPTWEIYLCAYACELLKFSSMNTTIKF